MTNTFRITTNPNCYQTNLVAVISSKNNRHWCKIDRFWNIWKCFQNGLHAWPALGGWGRFPQQEGVVGNHWAVVILQYHRGEEELLMITTTLHWRPLVFLWWLPLYLPVFYIQSEKPHTTYVIKQFGNEQSSNLWIVDSRVLSWDCENDHAQELDQVFRSAEVFWKACWWNYSVLSTQYIYI